MVAAHPGRGLRPPPRPRHDELRRERGPGTRPARSAGRGARATVPTSRSTPIRTPRDAPLSSAMLPSWASEGGPEAILARLRDDDTAERIRHHMEVDRRGRLPRRAHRLGHHRDLGRQPPRARRTTSARPSPGPPRGGARRPGPPRAGCSSRTGSDPTILQHVGHEENVRADHAPPGAHRRQRRHPPGRQAAPARLRHLPALSRALRTGVGHPDPGGDASPTSPRAPPPVCACPTAAWSARATAPTSSSSTRTPSRRAPPSTPRARCPSASRTS